MNLYLLIAVMAVLPLVVGYLFGRYTKMVIGAPTAALILTLLSFGHGITDVLEGKGARYIIEDLSIGLAIAAVMGAGLIVGVKARRRTNKGSPDKP